MCLTRNNKKKKIEVVVMGDRQKEMMESWRDRMYCS